MKQLFRKKGISIMLVAATVALLLLVLILLTTLSQLATLDSKAKYLSQLVDEATDDVEKLNEFKQFRQSNEYVIEWAKSHDKLTDDQIVWIEEHSN